jgi:hypothetical protein
MWIWLVVVLCALLLIAVWRAGAIRRRPSFRALAGSAVDLGEQIYGRLVVELVLAGQLASMATSPARPATALALADLREELDNLRLVLRGVHDHPFQARTAIPDSRRCLVVFEVALRTFRNEARSSA